jgi:hypothetical protein
MTRQNLQTINHVAKKRDMGWSIDEFFSYQKENVKKMEKIALQWATN